VSAKRLILSVQFAVKRCDLLLATGYVKTGVTQKKWAKKHTSKAILKGCK